MAANYTRPPFEPPSPKPSKLDRVLREEAEKREAEAVKRQVYRDVDLRDERRCIICGRHGNPNATTTLGRLHRVHLVDLSLGGEMSTRHVYLGCWICHAVIHAKQLFPVGMDANQDLRFEILEAAVVHVFGSQELPKHVSIITPDGERRLKRC